MNEDVSKTVRFNNTVTIIHIPCEQSFIEEGSKFMVEPGRTKKISYRIRFEIRSYAIIKIYS